MSQVHLSSRSPVAWPWTTTSTLVVPQRFDRFTQMNCFFLNHRQIIYSFWQKNRKKRWLRAIINDYWTRLRKISYLSVASRSIICQSRRLSQIIDLRDTDKSWYFVLTKFNNCFIIRSPSLFSYFNHFLTTQGTDLPVFSLESVVPITHERNIICSKTRLNGTSHEQTIIWRQLFAGHEMDSRPMER